MIYPLDENRLKGSAMRPVIVGVFLTTLSLPVPTSALGYGTAEEVAAMPATQPEEQLVAKRQPMPKAYSTSAKGSVRLLDLLKKERKEKGGGS
jgi:hypothetical protein